MPHTDSNVDVAPGNRLTPDSACGSAILDGPRADSEGSLSPRTVLSPDARPHYAHLAHPRPEFIRPELRRLPEYIAVKIEIDEEAGCWNWTARFDRQGYGRIRYAQREFAAHRAVYEFLTGAIPDGLTIDHLCCNKACVNPDHLEPVDGPENTRRWAATITHCHRGHEFSPENTYRAGSRRSCRLCGRLRSAKYAERKRSKARA